MKKILALLILLLATVTAGFARTADALTPDAETVTFRFRAGADMFLLKGNEAELTRLYALVDTYREQIADGRIPVYVDGYCASLPTAKENRRTAYLRASRVKSELVTQKGLREVDFRTTLHTGASDGGKEAVTVTLRIPAPEAAQPETPAVNEPAPAPEPVMPATPAAPAAAEPQPAPVAEAAPQPAPAAKPYCFAVRTNVLYDAMLLPTLGVEWRVSSDWGVKLDGSFAHWSGGEGKVQKVWLLNPEVRRYLLRNKRFYVGVSGSYGEYNIYKYPLGGLFSKNTGYQGSLWSAGLTVGYQLYLSRRFSVDFNLGLGYTRSEYDSFTPIMTEIRIPGDDFPAIECVRVIKERSKTKNFFGPTQAGINLIWTIGGNKQTR
ncbi:DUF3575 domain-containing protein [Alistipes sp.]|uniref:DUF3575 domain-containing protein n=1 Tax=unclassified Alistipes TaxID=2608932 RepID=UPI001D66EAFC|nr:DUF3575 domain-containing protein [Alistipes shahii]